MAVIPNALQKSVLQHVADHGTSIYRDWLEEHVTKLVADEQLFIEGLVAAGWLKRTASKLGPKLKLTDAGKALCTIVKATGSLASLAVDEFRGKPKQR